MGVFCLGSAKVPVSLPIPSDEFSDEQTRRVKELLHSPTVSGSCNANGY